MYKTARRHDPVFDNHRTPTQWRTEGSFGVFEHPRNSEGPPKSCQTEPDF